MIRELYTEDLDINLKYNIYLHCVQNDDVILNINVYDKSLQADLSNYTCRLKAFKSDHIPLIQNTNIDVTGNVVKIEASKQLTTTAGIVKAELQFTDKSTLKKKSTFFIEIKVEKSALNVDGALSTPMCTLLEEIDNKLDQIENIGQVLDEAKQVRDTLESDIVVGNTTNENIVQSISDADSKKREVEISISNASDKISEVEDSITNADNSRNALDRSKEVANETKIDLDNANVQAEKNIEELNKLGDVTDLAAKVQTNTENISKNNKSIEEVNSHLNDITNSGYLDLAKDANGADYKTIKSNGFYRNVTGTPTAGTSGVLQVMANTDKWSVVYRWSTISNAVITEYISCKDGDNYSQWKQISNNQNKEIELPLNSPYLEYAGVSAGYSNKIIRKDNGTIIISFCVKKADGSRISANELMAIANIPVGYRIKACFGSASIWGGFKPSLAYIDGSHTLTCRAVEEGEAIVGNIIGEAI